MSRPLPPGLVIAATHSGAGKTTLTLGILAALRARGVNVAPFKCGPDYIDPAFHAAAAGRASFNLDSWAMTEPRLAAQLAQAAGADLALAEGVMGLFDGVAQPGATGTGASADIAALTGWPVVLVLDVSGQAQTAAALARGMAAHRPGVHLAGVVLNRVAGARHEALVRSAMDEAEIPVLGVMPREKSLGLPERHLGLVQAGEHATLDAHLERLGAFAAQHLDLDALLAAARPTLAPPQTPPHTPPRPQAPGGRIALARDTAFSFIYPHLLAEWRAAGAEILPFSPLADEAPDPDADLVWLPGGYPELHAGRLAAAETFRAGMTEIARTRPVHGECGGYMVLGAGLIDKDGTRHRMLGLLGLETSFAQRRLHLGYRRAELHAPLPGHAAGRALLGHEFHYATILSQPDPALARVTDANGAETPETGSRRGQVTGSFFHLIAEAP
ncbi:cobyrinate a,c-diamide synthase [Phaeovulum vinaykumarii]|uniref:Hydrogenobyrinate a,c-diamide synthase n=1 Tax=Phaeovulum vinaykumarii TaxID=407234 RepID=A0A1N7KCR6_9RHOB|nr:cobyrinate a,c-diamide synthase [Phaeovulum vinaykumarii]SIS59342.1 hydrogenobyrinic acid a,c-diamide synthase (glutamine-hydrolysing) /cobyrinate a,c-diamide synthase [Phaeovulum vinaykumarii]SOB94090.1 cobyrinic acid a,c-diamide synthase [Phaeovulum vinaykumarii]